MGAIEDRKVLQDFPAPELLAMAERLDSLEKRKNEARLEWKDAPHQ